MPRRATISRVSILFFLIIQECYKTNKFLTGRVQMQMEHRSEYNKSDLFQKQKIALNAFLNQGSESLNDDLSMQLVALWWEEENLWVLYRNWHQPDRTLGDCIHLPNVPEDIAHEFYTLREPSPAGWHDSEHGVWWQCKEERPETWPPNVIAALEETKEMSELRPHTLWLTSVENQDL